MKIQRIERGATTQMEVAQAVRVLRGGGVVLFPSDTCYGLAVDALQPHALERLFRLKQRPHEKAVSCIFESIDAIAEYALVGEKVRKVLERNLPGPFTFLLPARPHSPLPFREVGARIPDCALTQLLAHALGKPYTATSANLSGLDPCYSVEEFLRQCHEAGATNLPNLALERGELPRTPPSTVVDLSAESPHIVRLGAGVMRY